MITKEEKLSLKREVSFFTSKNISMFPLICNDKKPAIDKWKEQNTSEANDIYEVIDNEENIYYNYGIVTGKKSGILVIDVDRKNGNDGLVSLQKLENKLGALPEHFTVKTPNGGYHYYFKYPMLSEEELKLFFGDSNYLFGNKAGRIPGIDIRGEGGYVVAPGSKINDKYYERINEVYNLNELPLTYLRLLYTGETRIGDTKYIFDSGDLIPGTANAKFVLPAKIEKGNRNDVLFRFGCSLIGQGMTLDDAMFKVKEVNETITEPPLTNFELENTIFKSLKEEKKKQDKKYKEQQLLKITSSNKTSKSENEKLSQDVLDEIGCKWLIPKKSGEFTVDDKEYALYFKLNHKDLFYIDNGWCDFNMNNISSNDIYRIISEDIAPFVHIKFDQKVKDIMKVLEVECEYSLNATEKEQKEFYIYNKYNSNILHYNDELEIFDICDDKRVQPKINCLNVPFGSNYFDIYNENLEEKAPLFNKWLNGLFDEVERDTFQEFIGYTLIPDRSMQIMLNVIGPAGIGKSRIYTLLEVLHGNDKISSCSLHNLSKENYLASYIRNKMVIYDDDIKTDSLNDTELLKKLISDSSLNVREIYGKGFNTKLYTKVIACGNQELLTFLDRNGGMDRRIINIKTKPFSYMTSTRKNISEREFKIIWENEKEYILAWALKGLARLIANKMKLTHYDKLIEIKQEIKIQNDSVYDFIYNSGMIDLTNNIEDFVEKSELYDMYKVYCNNMCSNEMSGKTTFYRRFEDACNSIGKPILYSRKRLGGTNPQGIILRVKDTTNTITKETAGKVLSFKG